MVSPGQAKDADPEARYVSDCSDLLTTDTIPDLRFPREGYPVINEPIAFGKHFRIVIPGAEGGQPPISYTFEDPHPTGVYHHITRDNKVILYGAILDQSPQDDRIYKFEHDRIFKLNAVDSSGQQEQLKFSITERWNRSPFFDRWLDRSDTDLFLPYYTEEHLSHIQFYLNPSEDWLNSLTQLSGIDGLDNVAQYSINMGNHWIEDLLSKTATIDLGSLGISWSHYDREQASIEINNSELDDWGVSATLEFNEYPSVVEPKIVFRRTTTEGRHTYGREPIEVTVIDGAGRQHAISLHINFYDLASGSLEVSLFGFEDTVEPQAWRIGQYITLPLPLPSLEANDRRYFARLEAPEDWASDTFREIEGNLVGKVEADKVTPSGTIKYRVSESIKFKEKAPGIFGPDSDVLEIPVTIQYPELGFTEEIQNVVFKAQEEVLNIPLPPAIGGDGVYEYTISPPLPEGVVLVKDMISDTGAESRYNYDPSIRSHRIESQTILGVVKQSIVETEYTYTVTDGDGTTSSINFTLEALEASPSFLASSFQIQPPATGISLDAESDITIDFSRSLQTSELSEHTPHTSNGFRFDTTGFSEILELEPKQIVYEPLPSAIGGQGQIEYTLESEAEYDLQLHQKQDGSLAIFGYFGQMDSRSSESQKEFYKLTARDSVGQEASFGFFVTSPYQGSMEYIPKIPNAAGPHRFPHQWDLEDYSSDLNTSEYFFTPPFVNNVREITYYSDEVWPFKRGIQPTTLSSSPFFKLYLYPEIQFDPPLNILSSYIEDRRPYISLDPSSAQNCYGRFEVEATFVEPMYGKTDSITMGINLIHPSAVYGEDTSPRFTQSVPPQTLAVGELLDIPLPTAVGGNGHLAYRLEIPDIWEEKLDYFSWGYTYWATIMNWSHIFNEEQFEELSKEEIIRQFIGEHRNSFQELRGRLFGSAMEPLPQGVFKWIVTDADGDQDILEIPITIVADEVRFTEEIEDQVWNARNQLVELNLPTARGGTGAPYSYELTADNYSFESVPFDENAIMKDSFYSGLQIRRAFMEDSVRIYGVANEPLERTRFTYTVTDRACNTVSQDFYITITDHEGPPTSVAPSQTSTTFTPWRPTTHNSSQQSQIPVTETATASTLPTSTANTQNPGASNPTTTITTPPTTTAPFTTVCQSSPQQTQQQDISTTETTIHSPTATTTAVTTPTIETTIHPPTTTTTEPPTTTTTEPPTTTTTEPPTTTTTEPPTTTTTGTAPPATTTSETPTTTTSSTPTTTTTTTTVPAVELSQATTTEPSTTTTITTPSTHTQTTSTNQPSPPTVQQQNTSPTNMPAKPTTPTSSVTEPKPPTPLPVRPKAGPSHPGRVALPNPAQYLSSEFLIDTQVQQFLPPYIPTPDTRVRNTASYQPVIIQPQEQATQTTVRFTDITSSLHRNDIRQLAEMGISQGCNPPHNTNYCPNQPVTRAEMATFLTRALNLPPTNQNPFTDTTGNTHHNNINRIAAAGITQGCNPPHNTNYCPDTPVTRAEMATFLTRALNLPTTQTDKYQDDNTSIHQQNINTIAAAGITQGCNPPTNTNYCPDTPVTRAEMATFLTRALNTRTR